MNSEAGGRGSVPKFSVDQYRGAPPEIRRILEEAFVAPVSGDPVGKITPEYVTDPKDLDSFVIRGSGKSMKVVSFEPLLDKLLVQYEAPGGKTEQAEASVDLLQVFQNRNRAVTRLEAFLEKQLESSGASEQGKEKLKQILQSVAEYQKKLMLSVDQELRLSHQILGDKE